MEPGQSLSPGWYKTLSMISFQDSVLFSGAIRSPIMVGW